MYPGCHHTSLPVIIQGHVWFVWFPGNHKKIIQRSSSSLLDIWVTALLIGRFVMYICKVCPFYYCFQSNYNWIRKNAIVWHTHKVQIKKGHKFGIGFEQQSTAIILIAEQPSIVTSLSFLHLFNSIIYH